MRTGGRGSTTLDVSVVFGPNERHIEACLESLFREAAAASVAMAVTVVANGSGHDLADVLEKRFPGMEVVRNERTLGFAENHNRVLRRSTAEYVLVLNDDVVLLPGSLRACLAFFARPGNENVAVVAPRLLNPDGSLQPSTYSFPTLPRAFLSVTGLRQIVPFGRGLDLLARMIGRGQGKSRFWAHDRTVDIDTFRGAFVLVRGETVRQVGVMDEVSKVGVEETEWHRRMRDAGWRVVFHPEAEVIHHGSATIAGNYRLRNEYLKGFLNYFRKHRSGTAYRGFAVAAAAGLTGRAAVLALRGRGEGVRAALAGAAISLRALRGG